MAILQEGQFGDYQAEHKQFFDPFQVQSNKDFTAMYDPLNLFQQQQGAAQEAPVRVGPRPVALSKVDPNQAEYLRQARSLMPNTQGGVAPTTQPSLQDIINEAQKLGIQQTNAQRGILRADIEDVTGSFIRDIHGRNVDPQGSLGKDTLNRAVAEQGARLEPYAMKTAADLGQQALSQTFQSRETEKARDFQKANTMLEMVNSGQLTGTPMAKVLADFGVDDPTKFMTADGKELELYAISKGLTVNEVMEQRRLLGRTMDQDIRNHPERYAGLAVDPQAEYERELQLARAANTASDDGGGGGGGTVLCTALHDHGEIPTKIYKADIKHGRRLGEGVMRGYHFWAIPVTKIMRKNKIVYAIMKPIVKAWSYQMAYKEGVYPNGNFLGFLLESIGAPLCGVLGKMLKKKRRYSNG